MTGSLHAQAIEFSGYTWEVRSGTGGPGPNTFVAGNVLVDANGYLHLRISQSKSKWTTAEVFTDAAFGFGTYQFKIIGRPDQFDTNVVLGLFNYTTPEIGPMGRTRSTSNSRRGAIRTRSTGTGRYGRRCSRAASMRRRTPTTRR